MKSPRFDFLGFVLVALLFGCSEEVEWENADSEQTQEPFYLVNGNRDTIPTGVSIPVDTLPFNRPRQYASLTAPRTNGNIRTKKLARQSNRLSIIEEELPPPSDTCHPSHHWQRGGISDSLKHPKPIHTTGTRTPLLRSDRKRLLPPVYKENAIADIQSLSIDQGLVSSNINDILFDRRGYTWLATDYGLVKYDGIYATTYHTQHGLPGNHIMCLEEDSNGAIWMGFEGQNGFAKLDGNSITYFNKESASFGATVYDLMFDDQGKLYIGTIGRGLCTFDGTAIETYDRTYGSLSHKMLSSLHQTSDGTVCFINFGLGIGRFTGDELCYKDYQHANWIPSMIIDSKERMIAGGVTSNFFIHDGGRITKYKIDHPAQSYILDIKEDPEKGYWLATTNFGVVYFDGEQAWKYGVDEGLPSNLATTIEIDPDGQVWVGTVGGGLNVINRKSFSFKHTQHGLPGNQVYGVTTYNGQRYYATDKGLAVEDGDSIMQITEYLYNAATDGWIDVLSVQYTDVLVRPGGKAIATAMNFGICNFRTDFIGMRRLGGNSGYFSQNPNALAIDSKGHVYCTANDKDRLTSFQDTAILQWVSEQGYAYFGSVDLDIDGKDRIWVASRHQGIAMFDHTQWIYYSTNEGLVNNNMIDVYVDNQDRVWFSMEGGALQFIQDGKITTVELDGIPNNAEVRSIIQDPMGGYWFGLNEGLVHLKKTSGSETWSVDNYTTNLITRYDGMISKVCLPDAMYIDDDNKLYIGTDNGLMIKDLNTVYDSVEQPTVFLHAIDITGKSLDVNRVREKGYLEELGLPITLGNAEKEPFTNIPSSLELPYSHNHLTFHFEGTALGSNPQRLSYEYYVEGYDETWLQATDDQKAEYRNLPYGTYTLHLRSYIDPDHPSNEYTYTFTILPPWYHTWWARTLFVGGGLLLIWLVFRIRTRQLRARQQELEETVASRTSELREKHDQLEDSHKEIRDSIAYAKRIQSAILPPAKLVKSYLPNNFILYKPKDVVAGDFYWMANTDKKVLFAAADCTGHGVPGAMVSVICNNGLNRAVNEFGLTDPGLVLDKTRELVIQEFEKSEDDVKDGMDISLCSLDLETGELLWAGANNPLWIIKEDGSSETGKRQLLEIKGDKQPIGKYQHQTSFTTHPITISKGDVFYIFSDGFADQFGGPKGKKFKTSNFKELLLSICHEPMDRQCELLEEAFEGWRGEIDQIDDVCIIGVRV